MNTLQAPLRPVRNVHRRRILAAAALTLICSLLGACSAIRTVYNQAERLIAWRADDYFDLTDEQKRLLHARFQRLHAWHRGTQLGEYASLLEAADRRLTRGPTLADVVWAQKAIREQSRAVLLHSQADIAELLATLSDRQIANARRHFERDNRRFAKEHGFGASPGEQHRLRAKRLLESIEHWSGPLDFEQQAHISALSEALPLDAAYRMRDRVRRQRDFLALLDARHDGTRFAALLRDWLSDWDASRPADVAAEADRYAEAYDRMLLLIYAELRPDQRRRVSERLRWYVEAMRDLSRPRA